jgi:hypothetical protein
MSTELNDAELLSERPTGVLAKLRTRGMMMGAIGMAAMVFGFFTLDRTLFFQSYLIGFVFWMGITMGSLAMLMLQYLTGGAWGLFARRVFEASSRNVVIMAVLFIPIAMNLPVLYPWARPDAVNDPVIQSKIAYLNTNFFLLRAVLYFGIMLTLSLVLTRWSREQDREPTRLPGPKDGRLRFLSGPGLVLYMIMVTFMSVDWVMSLDPHFTSTIFGILMLGGQGLSTLAFTILILSALSRAKPVSTVAKPDLFHDLGKLMLCFVMLWAYFNVSQLIIIYQGNLPEEIPWYLHRLYGLWMPIAIAVLLGHFVLPFFLLLSRDLKRHAGGLGWLSLFVLLMRVIDITWTIGPIFRENGHTLHWMDFAAVIGLGGIWLTMFFMQLGRVSLVPAHDPYFKEAMANVGH